MHPEFGMASIEGTRHDSHMEILKKIERALVAIQTSIEKLKEKGR